MMASLAQKKSSRGIFVQAYLTMTVIDITDKECMHITGSDGQEKTKKQSVLTRSKKGRCEQEQNHTASTAVADDIDFGGGIAFS